MNEQLQSALADILNKTINGIDSSVAFMEAQLPDVVEQLLTWYMVKSSLFTFVGVCIVLLSLKLIIKFHTLPNEQKESHWGYERDFRGVTHTIAGIMFSIFSPIITFVGVMFINIDFIQIMIAPKIWLIEYAAELAK